MESQCLALIPAAAVGCAPRFFPMRGTGFSILPEAGTLKDERNFYWGMALELGVIFKSALPGAKCSRKIELIAQWDSGELHGTVASILNGGIWPKPWADYIWIISNNSRASFWQVAKKHLRFQKLHCLVPQQNQEILYQRQFTIYIVWALGTAQTKASMQSYSYLWLIFLRCKHGLSRAPSCSRGGYVVLHQTLYKGLSL